MLLEYKLNRKSKKKKKVLWCDVNIACNKKKHNYSRPDKNAHKLPFSLPLKPLLSRFPRLLHNDWWHNTVLARDSSSATRAWTDTVIARARGHSVDYLSNKCPSVSLFPSFSLSPGLVNYFSFLLKCHLRMYIQTTTKRSGGALWLKPCLLTRRANF